MLRIGPGLAGTFPIILTVLWTLAAACGDDDEKNGEATATTTATTESTAQPEDDEADVEAAIRAANAAFNDDDAEAWAATLTDNFLQQVFNTTREQARDTLNAALQEDPPITITDIRNIEISGDDASAEVSIEQEGNTLRERHFLVREDGQWRLDSVEELGPE